MRRKKKSWFVSLYNDNKLYIWVIVGVLTFSGISIGMAMGSKLNQPKLIEQSKEYSVNTNVEEIVKPTNVKPIQDENTAKKTSDFKKESSDKNNVSSNDNKEDNTNNEVVNNNIKKELEFIFPVTGDVIKDFSKDTLVYSNTLEQWVNHDGIDIVSNKATPVKVIEEGTVTDIKQDPRYGYTIIVDHGQGYSSVYCNLSTLDMVYINKSLEKGQVISGIGDTALFESKDQPHLHFELIKDGKNVNPVDYIK